MNARHPTEVKKNPTYAAMIESVDRSVGSILEQIAALELTDNTLVIFYSDNGGAVQATSNQPLRGYKGMLYEGGIRVPLAVKWPAKITPDRLDSTPVSGIDFYPTLLEIAGAESPAHTVDGTSLVPIFIENGGLAARNIYWHFPAYLEAAKGMSGPWRTTPAGAIRSGDYKLIEFFENGALELYNLRKDPGESENLAHQLPEKTELLHEKLRDWREKIGADMPTPK